MDSFLPDYRDPIFSIILILLIAFAISIASYGWSIYRQERLKRRLFGFLDRFDSGTCALEEENIPFEEGMEKPLLMLARAYEKSGDYSRAISICLYLIRHTRDDEILIYLGKVYLRAGFLKRAEDIFEEIISRHPRRKDVLYNLELLYDTLHDYEGAKEALEAREAQGEKISRLSKYIEYRQIVSKNDLSPSKKVEALCELLGEEDSLYRPVIRQLFALNTESAWESVKEERVEEIMDILWYLPYSQLQLDIIKRSKKLSALYFARGDIEDVVKECGIFELDMLCAARKSGFRDGDMLFSYLCRECKNSFPVSFERCPECMAVNSIEVEESLAKKRDETGETLL